MKNAPVLYAYKHILALSYIYIQTTRFRNQIQSKIKRPRLFLSFSSLFRFLITYLFMNFFYTHLPSCSHSSLFLLNSSLKGSFKHLFKEKKSKSTFSIFISNKIIRSILKQSQISFICRNVKFESKYNNIACLCLVHLRFSQSYSLIPF